jgi:c-di-GMP-related signal transduction protein
MMRARGAQSNRAVYMRLLAAISKPNLDWRELEEIVKSDPMLYYRLLRYLNSAIFGLQGEVRTVGQALTFLGEKEIRRWCHLSGMLELSRNKPSDLALAALVRARFAESIGSNVGCGGSNLFQVGLLIVDGRNSGNSHARGAGGTADRCERQDCSFGKCGPAFANLRSHASH